MVFSILTISIHGIRHGILLLQEVIFITTFGQPITRQQVSTTIMSSRLFTILVLSALRCQLPMRLQVLPQRVRILQHNQRSMLTVHTIRRLSETTSVIISGQAAVRQLLSTSLLRAFATTLMARSAKSTIAVAFGRRFRATSMTVAAWSSAGATCTRWNATIGPMGSRRVRSQNNSIDLIYLQAVRPY